MNMDLVQYAAAMSAFRMGQVDYLIPSEIYSLANRLESAGYSEHAEDLRMILLNRYALV